MKVVKIILDIIFMLFIAFTTLCTLYCLFANNGYGIEMIGELFEDGFFSGIKNFFVSIWEGFKYVLGI